MKQMFYSDDPLRDFDRYDMAMASKEAKLPVCDKCGTRINEDFFNIGGDILCENCVHDEYGQSLEDYLSDNY